jgi:transcriptional regulator GlxA family with amidase domain
MTYIPKNKPKIKSRSADRLVVFVAYTDVCLLDLSGPQTVFWAASNYARQRGLPGYELVVASLKGGTVRCVEGVAMQTVAVDDLPKRLDTLMLPGAPAMPVMIDEADQLVAWIRKASRFSRRVASVCSGAFLLARTGLLDGKQAATHWAMCDQFREKFPSVGIERDAIFVRQGSIWTSAGVTTGIDLALALVEEDCGREVAMEVARELVVFLKRPGGQSQFSTLLQAQTQDKEMFDELHRWIVDNLARADLSVDRLAERASMSPRNFARVYKQATGRTPAKAVELFRLEAARRLLENSDRNIDQIAGACGFGDEERMRITFQRNLGVSPRDYRKRFSGGSITNSIITPGTGTTNS